MDNVDKFNKMGVTENTVQMLDTFNDKMEPLTPEEKEAEEARKQHLLRAGNNEGATRTNKLVGDRGYKPAVVKPKKKKEPRYPIQCIKVVGKNLQHLADPNLPKQYTTGDIFKETADKPAEEIPNPKYYYIKLYGDHKEQPDEYEDEVEDVVDNRPKPGVEKIDTGDDDLVVLKVRRDQLQNYDQPGTSPDQLSKLKHLFKDADENEAGVECFFRRVYGGGQDHPETAEFRKVPVNTTMEDLYEKLRAEGCKFDLQGDGIQLMKVVGNIDPKEKNKHAVKAKRLYDNKDKDGNTSGTTVQSIKLNRVLPDGTKEPIQYIKTVKTDNIKPGENPVQYYVVKGKANLREMLEDMNTTGKLKGTENVDFSKVRDEDLPRIEEAFRKSQHPQTYYYSNVVEPNQNYKGGKINSVTVLNDPKNKVNKNNKIFQVFRRAEDADEAQREKLALKNGQPEDKFYFTNALGDNITKNNLNNLTANNISKEANMKDLYNNVKGDMTNNPNDDEFVYVIKCKGGKDVKDALNKIKIADPALKNKQKPKKKPKKPAIKLDDDQDLHNIRDNTRMKQVYDECNPPEDDRDNGALFIKCAGDTQYKDIIDHLKNSGLLTKKPEEDQPYGGAQYQSLNKPTPDALYCAKLRGDRMKKPEDITVQSVIVPHGQLTKLEKPNDQYGKTKLDTLLRAANPNEEKEGGNPQYYYVYLKGDVSKKPDRDIQFFKCAKDNSLKDIYDKIKVQGGNLKNPDESLQLIKVTGYPNDTILKNYIKQSQPLYRPGDAGDKELPVECFYATAPTGVIYGKPQEVRGDDDLKYMLVNGDLLNKNKIPGKLNDLFRGEPKKLTPPAYYYRPVSNPSKQSDYELHDTSGETSVDNIYQNLKNAGLISCKPGEGVQIFKVTGPAKGDDFSKHIKESETLYKKPRLPEDDEIRVQTIKLNPKGKGNDEDSIVYLKISGYYRPDEYYKTPGNTDLTGVLNTIQEKGKPEVGGKPFEPVVGNELEQVKIYFKPKADDLTKPKIKDDDIAPKAFFYTSKIVGKEDDEPNLIQSVTLLSDTNNTLNKGDNVQGVFKQKKKLYGDMKPRYFYTPFRNEDKDEDIKVTPCDENSNIGEVFDRIKNYGVDINKDGDGFQLVRTLGDFKPTDMNEHLGKARKLSRFPDDSGRIPDTYYYKTQAADANKGGDSGEPDLKGLIASVTIKRDPNNKMKKNKDVQTVFNEDEEDEDKPSKDLGKPSYYFAKVTGGVNKPEEMELTPVTGDCKLDDIYNHIKNKGPMKEHDGIQLFKILGEYDNNTLGQYLKETGEYFNNPEDDLKSKEPTESYYNMQIHGDKPKEGEIPGTIESVTVQSPQNLLRNYTVGKVFNKEDPNTVVYKKEEENMPNPVYYYVKVAGDSTNRPKDLVPVNQNDPVRNILTYATRDNGNDDTIIVKAPEDKNKDEILNELRNAGVSLPPRVEKVVEPEAIIVERPTESTKLINGKIPCGCYVIAEPEKEKEEEEEEEKPMDILSSSAESDNIVPDDNETVDNKVPKEMVRDIMKYSLGTIDQITVHPTSNEFLAKKTTFGDTITKTLQNDKNDTDSLLTGLHSLNNYLYNENGPNYSKLDLAKTYNLLHELQSKYYANPEILTQVNAIAGSLVKNLKGDEKGREYTKRFYDLIPESTKCQDNNPDLVLYSMKLMNDSLEKKPELVDEAYDETVPVVLSLMKLYKDYPEIQEQGYGILSQFAKNRVYSAGLINNGILPIIHETLENRALYSDMLKESKPIKAEVFRLLNNLSQDDNNSPKIADEIMGQLIQDLKDKGLDEDGNGQEIVTLLNNLLNNKDTVPPFVQYDGIDACIKLLDKNDSNVELAQKLFQIFKKVANASDEYKKMLQDKRLPDLVNRVIKKVGVYDKNLEFEGRQLIFTTNLCKIELEDPNKIAVDEIKIEEPIPPEVRNFLTNGKQVTLINDNGDRKQMQLIFTQDLMKVSGKKLKSNLPPKPKYIIDTLTIKKILKGHGTDAFKKSKGLFKKIPPPELCFSIIGPTTAEGMKALNVVCESEKDVERWIDYLKIVINYFKKTKGIKGNVLIKK